MSAAEREVQRIGPFVIVDEGGQDVNDEPYLHYTIFHRSRTEDHGCEGCWHDRDGLGYCVETDYYVTLNPEFRHDGDSLESTVAAAEELCRRLPTPPPPPASETNHFI